MTPDQAAAYKARKEAFVSNLSGSSLTEINLVTLVAASAILLWTALQRRQSFFIPYTPIAGVADFLLNVSAILFAFTLYSSAPLVLSIFLITPALALIFLTSAPSALSETSAPPSKQQKKSSKATVTSENAQTAQPSQLPVRPFLTHYRGTMMIATILAILAVDFPIFPRRYAKVETWGTSLMDLGVGSFIFSAGVVSARSVFKAKLPDTASKGRKQTTFIARFTQAIRHAIPLLILGLVRLYSVKGLDYAEHVTEYGVHWNFFFTLSLLPPFVEVADTITRKLLKYYDLLALLLAVIYEIVLDNTNLLRYILTSPRGPDLLSKNREGVFSFIGYLAIFLAGRGTGTLVVHFNESSLSPSKTRDPITITKHERQYVIKKLCIRTIVFSALFLLCTSIHGFNLNVSRRLANLPYVLWVVAFNNAQILLFGLVEALGPSFSYYPDDAAKVKNATSRILRVFNTNGLVIFLVANLLTGVVNLTMNTLDMNNLLAMAVLLAYASVLAGFALALDIFGVRIKI